jgi:hypothetical protein
MQRAFQIQLMHQKPIRGKRIIKQHGPSGCSESSRTPLGNAVRPSYELPFTWTPIPIIRRMGSTCAQ